MPNVNVFRQIFNVLGLAVSPSPASGFMFSLGSGENPYGGVNTLKYIPRVQSANISLSIPSEDVNQFGQAERVDNIITAPPDVSLSFDYLLLDGYAESLLGFAASGQQSFISGLLDGTQSEKNYFLGVAPEGVDLIGATVAGTNINVVGIGNGVVSDYSINLAVGQIPRASVTVQGTSMQTYVGSTGKASPAIDTSTALAVVGPCFTLPAMTAYTGLSLPAALRPGDIVMSFPRTGSFGDYTSGVGQIWVQGVSMSVPVAIDPIQQLGNPYPVAKRVRLPVNCSLSVDALAADISEDSTSSLLCSYDAVNLQFQIKNPDCERDGTNALTFWFNQAKLTNRDYSASIGQNSTVRLTYTNQLAGITSNFWGRGVVVSGSYGSNGAL